MIRRILSVTAATMLVLGAAQDAAAQSADVTYEISGINEMSVSGDPAKLLIDAGSELAGVDDVSTTWAVTTNQTGMTVQGSLGVAMPAGVTLEVELAKPTGTSVTTKRALTAVAQDLVMGITTLQQSGLGITYTLSATPAAGVVAEAIAVVTYTVVAGA